MQKLRAFRRVLPQSKVQCKVPFSFTQTTTTFLPQNIPIEDDDGP